MLASKHFQEWLNSCVDPSIIRLNVKSLSGTTPHEYLLYSDKLQRRNSGRLAERYLKRYKHLEYGGWWCSGVDVLTGEDSLWGCFKPDNPKIDSNKGKPRKYEHPEKVPTEIFALKLDWFLSCKVAKKYEENIQQLWLQRLRSNLEKFLQEEYSNEQELERRDPEGNSSRLPRGEKGCTEEKSILRQILEAGERGEFSEVSRIFQSILYRSESGAAEPRSANRGGIERFVQRTDRLFWQWVIENPSIPIIITEGAKKAGCLLAASYAGIALPGIFGGYRQQRDSNGIVIGFPRLIPQLEVFAKEGREFIFCFDSDSKPSTRKQVALAIQKTGKLLKDKGCKVSVMSWNYPEKGIDDVARVRGLETVSVLFNCRQTIESFKLKELLDLNPYVSLRINERYIPKNLVIPTTAQLIGIKSPKGTGKTQWIAQQVEEALNQEQQVFVPSHRIQLAKFSAGSFGIDYIEEIRRSDTKGVFGYSIVFDSLHQKSQARFSVDNWDGCLLIIDEVEQFLWHALNSQTCAKNRVLLLQNFQALLRNVVMTGGRIIVADADLSGISMNYLQKLIGEPINTWVVENNCNPNKGKRKLYTYNTPEALLAAIKESINNGEKVLIHTSAQKHSSKYSTINLERLLSPLTSSILRIDAESVAEPGHPAYGIMEQLNEELPKYQVVIPSPVIETGVSIDVKHFDKVFCFAFGVQTVNAVCQTVERVRDNVPRHIFVRKRSSSCVGNGSTEVKSLLNSQHQLFRANLSALGQTDTISALDDTQPESLLTWAKFACLHNMGYQNYRQAVLEKLSLEGYEILEAAALNSAQATEIKTEVKLNMEESFEEFCEKVTEAEPATAKELEQLSKKRSKTEQERLKEHRGVIEQKYGVEVSPELVKKDASGWYNQLLLHYYLTVGMDFLASRDKKLLEKLAEDSNGVTWKPDVNRRLKTAQIRALLALGILEFLQSGVDFTNESLQPWFDKITQPIPRSQIKTILGININPDKITPIQAAQILLGLLGLRLTYIGRPGNGPNRQRLYRFQPIDDGRELIFEIWRQRDLNYEDTSDEDVDLFIRGVDAA